MDCPPACRSSAACSTMRAFWPPPTPTNWPIRIMKNSRKGSDPSCAPDCFAYLARHDFEERIRATPYHLPMGWLSARIFRDDVHKAPPDRGAFFVEQVPRCPVLPNGERHGHAEIAHAGGRNLHECLARIEGNLLRRL